MSIRETYKFLREAMQEEGPRLVIIAALICAAVGALLVALAAYGIVAGNLWWAAPLAVCLAGVVAVGVWLWL